MRRTALAAVLVIVTLGVIWLVPVGIDSNEGSLTEGRYTCADGETIKIVEQTSNSVHATLPNGAVSTLKQAEAAFGTLYADPTRAVVVWSKENALLLQRNGKTKAYGCLLNSESTLGTRSRSLDTWFRSPTGPNGYGFTLQLPRTLEVDQPRPNYTRFLYAGPENEPPALTDGFTVIIGIVDSSPDSSLRSFVDDRIAQVKRVGGEVLTPVRDTTVRNRSALRWRQTSAIGGAVSHLAVALGDETVAHVSSSTVGAETSTYTQTIDSMLSTLRFRKRPGNAPDNTTTVPLALLADPVGAPERGCDRVVFVDHPVSRSGDLLTAALDTLFSIDRDSVDSARHFLAQTNETLSFDHALTSNDTAHVYLKGRLSGLRGVCDNPRARIQIEETARRITGADHVVLYLNGTRTTLQPNERDPEHP